jgi:heat shock protein HslJ
MKKISFLKLALFLLLSISFNCNKKNKEQKTSNESEVEALGVSTMSETVVESAHNSNNSLDWEGVYQGVLPCADCDGIKTRITLKNDNSYNMITEYLGKSDGGTYDSGLFIWDASGEVISIGSDEKKRQYKVSENILLHLDNDGNQITGDLADKYKLMKNYSDLKLENKKWLLTELMGQEVKPSEGSKISFVMFNAKEAMVSGNNGCNLFSGGYSIESGNRIKIGNMMNTMMACDNMDQASQFMGVLQKADNYTVVDGKLHLNKARMAPLAKFKLTEE